MRCNDFQLWLSRQLDGDLGAAEQAKLSGHLVLCAACRRDWELLSLGRRLCQSSRPYVPPSGDFASRVLRSVRLEKAQQRSTLWTSLVRIAETLVPAFAMLVVLFFGIAFAVHHFSNVRQTAHDAYREDLFVPAEEDTLLIADRGNITPDRVIATVLEGK